MASSLEAIKAKFALIRLKLALEKSGAGKSGAGNYTRYPAGNNKGGQFAPKGTGAGGSALVQQTPHGGATFIETGWKGSGMWAKPSAPPAGAKPHPQTNDQGKPVSIDYPSKASHQSTWTDRTKSAVFTPGGDAPATLNGVAMKTWNPPAEGWSSVKGTNPALDLDTPFVPHPTKNTGAGVMIVEPDGRLWLTRPTNAFGGYQNTYPKGTAESGLTLQQNAIKEAHEETGLKVQITGILGDFERDTSKARFYIARRVGGTPKDMGWESQAMTLATLKDARKLLNRTHDRAMLDELEDLMSFGKAKGGGGGSKGGGGGSWTTQARWPGGSALGGQWKAMGADGITLAPTVAGGLTGSNAIYQKTMGAASAALSSGDVGPVKAAIAKFSDKAAQFAAGVKGASHIKWGAQVHQWATQAVADHEAKTKATASVDAIAGPKTLSSFGLSVGAKPGGSNPGAMYQEGGDKWLVKGNAKANQVTPQQSDDRAKNEVLASKLMLAAGVGAPDMKLVDLEGKFGGGLGVASKMVEGATSLLGGPNPIEKSLVKMDFAVHAWLANYDVLGMGYDNTVIQGGKAINIDPGGALLFRAQGLPKDLAAHGGVLDPKAPEFETMRQNTSEQVAVFGSMTKFQLHQAAKKLANISDATIRKLVTTYGPGDAAFQKKLADNLIQRKYAIMDKVGFTAAQQAGIVSLTDFETAPKPERVKSTVDQKAVEVEAKAISAAAPKVDIPEKPTFNSSFKSADKFYDGMVKKFEAAHASGNMAALKEAATGGKYVNGLPWKPGTTNGIKIANYYNALVADLEIKAASTTVAAAKVADAVLSKPVPVPETNTMTPPAGGAMPNFEAAKATSDNKNASSHNPKVDLIAKTAMAGDVKGLLSMKFGTNYYAQKQVKLANDALAALGSPHTVAKGQAANSHPALFGGATLQAATAAAAMVKTPLPMTSTVPEKATEAVKESIKANKKKDWLNLKPGEKVIEQGEKFGVKYAKIETPPKGFKPQDIPNQPDFFASGNQGPTGTWKSSQESVNKANNDAVNLIHAIATNHHLPNGQSHVDAIKNIQFPVLDKATGQYGTKTIGIADHPAGDVKSYHAQVLAELEAQTKGGFKTVQSGTFTSGYENVAKGLAETHAAIPYSAIKNANRAADYVVLSKDAAASLPMPENGAFKEINPSLKEAKAFGTKSKSAFAALNSTEQSNAKAYTGGSYSNWNDALRNGEVDSYHFDNAQPMVKALAKAAVDIPSGTILWRGIGVGQSTFESVVGGIIQDGSFNSSSYGDRPAFEHQSTWLKIHIAGPGVKAISATSFSNYGTKEREIIIQNGVRYAVLKVTHHKTYKTTSGDVYYNKTIVELLALPHQP
ncbi:Nudix_Hydrolase domain containing protein [uncultured Caudovirales phage]|uniref:Nudix_Hydrolase domain containing protein n=1 Tax=uncultured Caudovirales phage TaxID=2100421 RepID=A0A6J5KR45_9CAUD|nr:Nudix_Hydrolase domain containing protein [uncultured Caudovirales phage]